MNTSLVSYNQEEFTVLQSMAKTMVESGFFADVKQVAQAMVKIQAGREIGPVSYTHLTLPTSDLV